MGPPTDITASELWLRLRERPRPSEVVTFPNIGRVRVRVLTMEEQDAARLAAHRVLKDTQRLTKDDLLTQILAEHAGDAVAKELIARACVGEKAINADYEQTGKPPVYPVIFPDGASLNVLTAAELSMLFGAFLLVQEKFGPTERTVRTPEERDAWVRRLAEGAGSYPLAQMPLPALAELTMSLAARCYSLCCILESLHATSPSTLDAACTSLGSGTRWSTPLPSKLEGIGSQPESDHELPVNVRGSDVITVEAAQEAARRLMGA